MVGLLVALVAAPLFPVGLEPLTGVVAPAAIHSLSAAACASCHHAAYDEWAQSRHAKSWVNPLFARSYASAPQPWCVNCHAPIPEQARDAAKVHAPLLDEGITCAACHLRDGRVLTSRPPTPKGLQAHPMTVEPTLAESSFCGGCHQFNFPVLGREPVEYTVAPMQDTVHEWQRSAAAKAGLQCQACHMEGGSSHRMSGAHDEATLRRAVNVGVTLPSRDTARVTLVARGVGHAFPTGDPFRAVTVELCSDASCEVALGDWSFQRTFRRTRQSFALAEDGRVPPPAPGQADAARTVDVGLEAAVDRLYWRARYTFPDPHTRDALVGAEREILLAEGWATVADGRPAAAGEAGR